MKGVVFAVLACAISYIASAFLPNPPGMEGNLRLLAIVGAIAGAGLAYLSEKSRVAQRVFLVVAALVLFTVSTISYLAISHGEPSALAEIALYVLAVTTFAPIGFLCEVAGVKYA